MKVDRLTSLEKSLAKTESDAEAALKATSAVASSLKKFRAAAQVGNLRELRKAIEVAEQAKPSQGFAKQARTIQTGDLFAVSVFRLLHSRRSPREGSLWHGDRR